MKSLSDPELPLEKASQNVLQILSACTLSPEQLSLIDKIVEKIATKGSAQLQADFYTKISEDVPEAKARLNFIDHSSLLAGTLRMHQEQLKLVEFEQLGKPFDVKSASPQISTTLKQLGLNEDSDPSLIRIVETDSDSIILMRSTLSEGFAEISEIRFLDSVNGNKLPIRDENNYGFLFSHASDNPFNDYFFACSDLAGDGCGTKDTRYAVDKADKLKYIVSVLNADQGDGECGIDVVVSRLEKKLIKRVVALDRQETIKCSKAPTIDTHGEPFQVYSEQDILTQLAQFGDYPNLAELVNFKRKDAADNQLKTKLWSQGERWKPNLLAKVLETIDTTIVSSTKSPEDAFKVLLGLVDQASSNLSNLKWLMSNPSIESSRAIQLADIAGDVDLLRQRLKDANPPRLPTPIDEPEYPYENVTIAIQREVQPQETAVVRLPEAPFVYFGMRMADNKLVILHSGKSLIDHPGVVRVMTQRGKEPLKFMFNGFTQDVWDYQVLSQSELAEYESYRKKIQEYQQQLGVYKSFQTQSVEQINGYISDIQNVSTKIKNLAEESRNPF
ncbi:MAG: hypothetical protein ACKVN9_03140 [Methylophilaceae bacterium]